MVEKTKEKETAIVQRKAEAVELVPDTKNLAALSQILLDSGMWPNLKARGVPGVFAIIEYGRELGIPPVAALNTMAIINGRLTMMATAMLAVANQRVGVTWKVESQTAKGCTMIFTRPGFADPVKISFNEKDAEAAGVLGKDNWKNWPQAMYFSKAASMGIRQIAPDAILGLYSKEEMEDTVTIMPGVGEVTEAKPEPVKTEEAKPIPEPEKEKEPEPPTEQKKETKETDPDKAEILQLLKALKEVYGRDPGDLLDRIRMRLKDVFRVTREKIPEDLVGKEIVIVRNALKNTLGAEEAAAVAAEKEGAL